MRSPVCCFLGHVDVGKTKLSDCLRNSNNQTKEHGGITQQFGVTRFSKQYLEQMTKGFRSPVNINGLMLIDTPGHDCFTSLRLKGLQVSDLIVVIVDVLKGVEHQTVEVIELLKKHKKPYVVVANKIDTISKWKKSSKKNVTLKESFKNQNKKQFDALDKCIKNINLQFAEHGINTAPYYKNPDSRQFASVVPVSANTNEGIPDLIMLISQLTEKYMKNTLTEKEFNRGYIIDKYKDRHHGYLLNVLLLDGDVQKNDKMLAIGSTEDGYQDVKVKDIFLPDNATEMRGDSKYTSATEVKASCGFMMRVDEPDKVVTGTEFYVVRTDEEFKKVSDIMKKNQEEFIKKHENIEYQNKGVLISCSYYAPIDSLIDMCKHHNIPVSGCIVGDLKKSDIMKLSARHKSRNSKDELSIMKKKHNKIFNVVLMFQSEPKDETVKIAKDNRVEIITDNIIYKLFDKYTKMRNSVYDDMRKSHPTACVKFTAKIIPKYVFRTKNPIVCGVKVTSGVLKPSKVCTEKNGVTIPLGIITSVEKDRKSVDEANIDDEVCLKIELSEGQQKVEYGVHFDNNWTIEPDYSDTDRTVRDMYPNAFYLM